MLLDLLYLAAAVVLTPYFLYRRLIRRKGSGPLRERLGFIPDRPAGVKRVWIHAVSVGEAAAAETLVKALKQQDPALDIVISTTTTTGQAVAAKRYGADKVFYYPMDFTCAVKRALDRVKPTVLVLMELEVWPNMTAEAVKRGIPVVVVNGRVSERAGRRYSRFWFLVGPSFRRVTRWLVQSDEYAARLKELGVAPETIEIAGNIKYDAVDVTLKPEERPALRGKLGLPADAPVLVGGSTHPTEEAVLLDACKQLQGGAAPNLRLILVPRHPERAGDVEREIVAAGFSCVRLTALRSQSEIRDPKSESAVLLVDTVGELKGMFKLADVAFVGGSLIPHGGQNIMEPCGLGIPVVHGPHMHNFNDAMEILRACNGAVQVTRETLAAELARLLADPAAARTMAARARDAFLQRQGATARTVGYLRKFL
jgi:3-deoxy-D-manno-octulosonic-acid transferase